MCSSPKMPEAPKPIPVPTEADPAVAASMEAERKRRAALGGFASTILAGNKPITPSGAAPKSLLGQ